MNFKRLLNEKLNNTLDLGGWEDYKDSEFWPEATYYLKTKMFAKEINQIAKAGKEVALKNAKKGIIKQTKNAKQKISNIQDFKTLVLVCKKEGIDKEIGFDSLLSYVADNVTGYRDYGLDEGESIAHAAVGLAALVKMGEFSSVKEVKALVTK